MKLKSDVRPACHLLEGKHAAAIWGGTFRKNIGYKSLLAALIGIFAACSLIAGGCIALIRSADAIRKFAQSKPKALKIFGIVVAVLVKVLAFLTEEE